jgi:hypothetical protein
MFEELEFPQVLKHLARAIGKVPYPRVIIERTDLPGLHPFVLDQETVNLFQVDPVEAIHSMSFEVQEAKVEKSKADVIPIEPPPVRIGYDTLSDAFGEFVYLRTRRASVECPGCGHWSEATIDKDGKSSFVCQKKCKSLGLSLRFVVDIYRLWASVGVEELLSTPLEKFFLPRPWNDGRSWITREELVQKYEAYKAEKEEACSISRA